MRCRNGPYVRFQLALCPSIYEFCFEKGFFPSAGYRRGTSGELSSVGSSGYAWSWLTSGASTLCIEFHASYAVFGVGYRSFGFILRCVQELTWNLFGGRLLPVCGVPASFVGGADACRFQWVCLVVVPFGYVFVLLVLWLAQCILYFGIPCVRFHFALCPRTYMGSVRGWFLPGCGVPEQFDGSVDDCRCQWLLLVVVRFGAVLLVVGVPELVCLHVRVQSFARFCVALCPSVYRLCFGMVLPGCGVSQPGGGNAVCCRFQL